MNKKNFTSRELWKKLKENGCDLESEFYWFEFAKEWYGKDAWQIVPNTKKGLTKDSPKAYDIIYDICVKYPKEFFGKGSFMGVDKYVNFTNIILWELQKGDRKEAEEYFWEHCLFNPKNQINN